MAARLRIGEILVDLGLITRRQLVLALAAQQARGERLGQVLLRMKLLEPQQLGYALVEQRRRWLFATLGSAFLAIHPAAAWTGTARGAMAVNATVVNEATIAVRRGGAAASLRISCRARDVVRGAIEPVRLGAYAVTPSRPAGAIACGDGARAAVIPIDAAVRRAAESGRDALVLAVAF